MNDLSHWHFAEHFSAYDAAALILGLEPRESETEQWRVGVITDRMQLDYKKALSRLSFEASPPDDFRDYDSQPMRTELMSVQLDDLCRNAWELGQETPLTDWLANQRLSRFDNQEFSRGAIIRWLGAIGMKSEYVFSRNEHTQPVARKGRWPWGDHHTEALGHLEAAASRFWAGYDSSDTSTANTNAQVSEWLQKERTISKTLADSIASILRLDGLPPGPRK